MDDTTKQKIIFVQELLKQNAPRFYEYYRLYKLGKKHDHGGSPTHEGNGTPQKPM